MPTDDIKDLKKAAGKLRDRANTPVPDISETIVEPKRPVIRNRKTAYLPPDPSLADHLARVRLVGPELDFYNLRPWEQLPDEPDHEYYILQTWLKMPPLGGRTLDNLQSRLEALSENSESWLDAFLVEASSVPAELCQTPTKLLHHLQAFHNWKERGRAYDKWQLGEFTARRKQQLEDFANNLHAMYLEHALEQSGLLKKLRQGLISAASSDGRLRRFKESRQMPGRAQESDKHGNIVSQAIGPGLTEWEFDPIEQLEAMNKIADRLFGPVPNVIDGDVTHLLTASGFSLPPGHAPQNTLQLEAPIPESKKDDSPWLTTRLMQIEEAEAQKALAPPETTLESDTPKPNPGQA